jgi:hypothetical protein
MCCRTLIFKEKPPGGNVTRPLAADDFSAIRARMEELRRERARLQAGDEPHLAIAPRPYNLASRPELARKPGLPPAIRRLLSRRAAD